jgi:hypothetical protein
LAEHTRALPSRAGQGPNQEHFRPGQHKSGTRTWPGVDRGAHDSQLSRQPRHLSVPLRQRLPQPPRLARGLSCRRAGGVAGVRLGQAHAGQEGFVLALQLARAARQRGAIELGAAARRHAAV